MNFNPESFVATAAASVQNSHHPCHQSEQQQQRQHQQLQHHNIPLPPSYGIEISIGSGSGRSSGGGGGSSSPKIMEWTNDDALELIEQYRCHTELWNRADPKYKDKLCRFRAWSEIAERFGCSKAEVERKMNVLLTQYRREKHKMFVKIYQGIQPNPSKWYAFKRFDFMEAGGGSLSGLPASAAMGGSASSVAATAGTTSHNGLNGLAAAAVAAAAYENSTIAAAANGGATGPIRCASGGGGGTTTATGATMPASQHRRIKTKELKYFGAMGLNIPMLIANSQSMDNWNTAGQYSPPIGGAGGGGTGVVVPNAQQQQQQQQLRVSLPMSYGAGAGGAASGAPYAVGGGGGGGGGSSSSDFQPSPHKTIDTSDNEDNNMRDETTATALGQLAAKVERRSPPLSSSNMDAGSGSRDGGIGNTLDSIHGEHPVAESAPIATALSEAGSSPIPNTNTNIHEAHKNHLLKSSPVSVRAATPRHAHEQLHHHGHHTLQHHTLRQHQDELDIKQELVDYFHPPSVSAAPPPPDSHRSYSSSGEESRLHLDMAQDLRVAQAKAQANFGNFVLPPRSSSSSAQLAAAAAASMPLNMRKLTAGSSAGHMLMNSLLSSRASMSDGDDNDEATESAASPGHIKSSVSAQDASSTAAAAAALYAESLSRDDCDFVGSNVSMKLRTMDRTQRIIAEKLISEVLFFGQFNELERTACIQPK